MFASGLTSRLAVGWEIVRLLYSAPMSISKAEIEHLAQFRYALRRFLHVSEIEARRVGIAPQQHQLLLMIAGMSGRDWANVAEIAERLQIRHHAAVALVRRAEKLGLVQRQRGTADRRVVQVSLRPAGRRKLERLSAALQLELRGRAPELIRRLRAIHGQQR